MKIVGLLLLCVTETLATSTIYVDEFCGRIYNLNGELRIRSSRVNTLPRNLNCTLSIVGQLPYPKTPHVLAHIRSINLPTSLGGNCNTARLELLDGNVPMTGNKGLCGSYLNSYNFPANLTNTLNIRFLTSGTIQYGRFEIIATTFHKAPCDSNEWMCSNFRCISSDLICNGRNNCGDNSDELYPRCDVYVIAGGIIAAIVLGSLLVVCFPVIFISILCLRRRRRYTYGKI